MEQPCKCTHLLSLNKTFQLSLSFLNYTQYTLPILYINMSTLIYIYIKFNSKSFIFRQLKMLCKTGFRIIPWGNSTAYTSLSNGPLDILTVWKFLIKQKQNYYMTQQFNFWVHISKKLKADTQTFTHPFSYHQVTMGKNQKQPKWPLPDEWIKKCSIP